MVSKCANPECAATFRYFHNGKLFRLEPLARNQSDTEEGMNKHAARVEFFWLCDDCTGKMTLEFENGVGVSVRPKLKHAAAAAA